MVVLAVSSGKGWASDYPGSAQAIAATAWTADDYRNHDFQSFEELPVVNQRINMDAIDYPLLHAAIFYQSNRQRQQHDVSRFSHSPALERAAKGHSDDMTAYDFFNHKSPVEGRETMAKRLQLAGASGGAAAENIAISFGIEYEANRPVATPKQNGGYFSYEIRGKPIESHTYLGLAKVVVKQWMESEGHRKNLLNPDYASMGAGASHYNDANFHGIDKFKSTQNFSSVKGD
jgi:uncharacterized protein YkwD